MEINCLGRRSFNLVKYYLVVYQFHSINYEGKFIFEILPKNLPISFCHVLRFSGGNKKKFTNFTLLVNRQKSRYCSDVSTFLIFIYFYTSVFLQVCNFLSLLQYFHISIFPYLRLPIFPNFPSLCFCTTLLSSHFCHIYRLEMAPWTNRPKFLERHLINLSPFSPFPTVRCFAAKKKKKEKQKKGKEKENAL